MIGMKDSPDLAGQLHVNDGGWDFQTGIGEN